MRKSLFILLILFLSLAGCRGSQPPQDGTLTPELPSPFLIEETQPPIELATQETPSESTPQGIPTGLAPATAEVKINANCRSGPGTVYQVIKGYSVAEVVDLVGISPDREWWVVRMEGGSGLCWIWGQLLAIDEHARDLPVFPMPPTPVVPAAGPGDVEYELTLLDLINQEREKVGVDPLVMEPRLIAAARSHSTDMAINDFFDHTGTGGTGFGQRIAAQGYLYSAAGETLFAGGNVNVCLQMWLDSSSHRETMLSPLFTHVGIGVFWYGDSARKVYVTADYASP